jgi:radial spoke head protein 9
MVQLEPNLALTLKHLASHGAVVSAEQQVSQVQLGSPAVLADMPEYCLFLNQCNCLLHMQAALDHSLPIKRTEAGLKTLVLWGKIVALNGKVCHLQSAISDFTYQMQGFTPLTLRV